MTIKIGQQTFAVRKPADLDARLLAATGCTAEENRRLLDGQPLPGRIAAAVLPFIEDKAPPLAKLAAAIQTEMAVPGNTVLADARKLYANIKADVPATTTPAAGAKGE